MKGKGSFKGKSRPVFQGIPYVDQLRGDWRELIVSEESKAIVRALNAANVEVSYVTIETSKGHDAFLLDEPEFEAAMTGFINATADACGLAAGLVDEHAG